ncbi:MAG: homoserine dehydrogenase [Anaerolineae bacterium]|nr:homoserine dehydrogenase [Anaerolineae bacterium]
MNDNGHVSQIPLIFLGLGNIGGTLLRQILETGETVAERTGLQLTPVAIADVSGVLRKAEGLSKATLHAALDATHNGGTLAGLPGLRPLAEVQNALQPGAILADLTATPKTRPTLLAALDSGCGVVLANKIPLAASWIEAAPLLTHPHLRYEVTVGAGLPVINTLHDLRDTGDTITLIEGCLSGTLGYLCAELERGVMYAEAVAQARAQGYTEPDPRDDLSGKDVARKALILARTAGWPLEEADITVEPLYSDALADLSITDFMEATATLNTDYANRVAVAKVEGKVLRYVARVTPKGGTVGLIAVDQGGPLGALRGPANYIALHTARYTPIPLALSGPGAGREVTAAGVFNDILVLAQKISSKELQ